LEDAEARRVEFVDDEDALWQSLYAALQDVFTWCSSLLRPEVEEVPFVHASPLEAEERGVTTPRLPSTRMNGYYF